jgi:hypothetical protein
LSADIRLPVLRRILWLSCVAAALNAAPAAAEPFTVAIDQSELISIPRPASTVIIGNPAIADATILDQRTVVITGHSFGTTNVIILDADGAKIASEFISVLGFADNSVIVHRPLGRQTFSCVPSCAPELAIGDNPASFDMVQSQINARQQLANGQQDNGKR